MAAAICASLLPDRMSARKSWPDCANRQVYSLPSVESRARVQVEQKACVTLEITPISPLPSLAAHKETPGHPKFP